MENKQNEHALFLWCMTQAIAYQKGNLSQDKIQKLTHLEFPFADYYIQALNYITETQNQACNAQHIECEQCDEMRYFLPTRDALKEHEGV